MEENPIIAIAVSDIHLSMTPPIARSEEPNWFEAMARQLKELSDLQEKHKCPILCSGDIFHEWKSPPELINFAIRYMPKIWAIPGQHDLPNHSLEQIKRSAYWTLVEAGKITQCGPHPWDTGNFLLSGFAWGCPVMPMQLMTRKPKICLHHAYTWKGQYGFKGAPEDRNMGNPEHMSQYRGYDFIITGDNHTSWSTTTISMQQLINPGSFFRRRSDEINHTPIAALIGKNGWVKHLFDCSKDVISPDTGENIRMEIEGLGDFLKDLKSLKSTDLDFPAALREAIKSKRISQPAKDCLLDALTTDKK